MSNLLKNLLFALGLAVLLFLGYWLFFKNSDAPVTASQTGAAQDAALKTQEFVVRLNELKSMEIDSQALADPRFISLVNFRQQLNDEPVSRSNPFAPAE